MSSHRSVMALLAVLTLFAKVTESAIAAPDVCTEADVGKGFCLTCKTKAKCVTAGSPPEPREDCAVAGEVCTVLSDVATCKPNAETDCSCDAAAQCDAYDPDSVLICLNGGVIISNNCSATAETCIDGECAAPVTDEPTPSPGDVCAGAEDGFAVITPMCTSAAYCSGGASLGISDCPSGNYFDMDEMICLPLPPVPCGAGCSDGACPDKSDCSKWYICSGGVVLDEETCSDETPVFDIDAKECQETGTCTGNDNCTYGLTTIAETTTTTAVSGGSTDNGGSTGDGGTGGTGDSTIVTSRPSECTADNVGQRYPYEGDCKKYWSCRQVGNDEYAYVESSCLGELVFNPDTGFCDTTENVPGCVPLL